MSNSDESSIMRIIGGCLGLLFVCFLIMSIFMGFPIKSVGSTEVAVAERFGEIKGIRNSGVHFEFFTKYTKYDTKVLKYESKQAAATNDLQDIDVDVTVTYRIDKNNAEDIYTQVGNQRMIEEKVLTPLVAQYLKSISTKYSGEEFAQKRAEVTAEVQKALDGKISKEYNISIIEVSLTNFTFTNPQFNAAIDKKQIAEQDSLKAKYELDKTKIEAEQQKVQKESLTPEILQRMWIEKWDGKLPTYVGDGSELMTIPAK